MSKRFTRTVALAAALGVVAALGAACGDNNGGTAGTGDTVTVDDGGLAGAPIKIGTLCSCSGPLAASLGQSIDVINAWASYTNNNGGLNGHPVEVVAYDDGQNPDTGLAMAKKLVDEDKVVAIVGTMSLVSDVWGPYVTGKGVPVVGGQPVDAGFFTNPMFFASGTTLPLLLLGEVTLAAQSGAKTIGLYYCSETPVCAQLPAIVTPMAEQAGMTVESAKVSQSATDYTAPCLAFKAKHVDAVFAAVNSDVVPRIAKSCAAQGFTPTQIASSATTQKSWTTEADLDGAVFAGTNAVYTDESVPGVKKFLDGLGTYAPSVLDSPQFSYPLLYPWAGGELFAAAAKAVGLGPDSTSADVVKGLHALKGETLGGIAPPLTFPEGQPGFPLCYFTGSVKDGAFNSDGDPTCIPAEAGAAMLQALAAAAG